MQGYLQQKQPEKALEMLQHATKRPDAPGAVFARLALVYSRLGKDDRAIEAAQMAIKHGQRPWKVTAPCSSSTWAKAGTGGAQSPGSRRENPGRDAAKFALDLAEVIRDARTSRPPSEKALITTNAMAALDHAASASSIDHVQLRLADDYDLLGDTTNAARIYSQLVDSFSEAPAIRAGIRDKLSNIYLSDKKSHGQAARATPGHRAGGPRQCARNFLFGRETVAESHKLPEAVDYFQRTITLSDEFEDAYYELASAQVKRTNPRTRLKRCKRPGPSSPGFRAEFLSGVAYSRARITPIITHFTSAEVLAKAGKPSLLDGDFY